METKLLGFDRVVLLDVQGLFGGCDLWLSAAGSAQCRIVRPPGGGGPGLRETRHAFTVPHADLDALGKLLTGHDLATMQTQNRYGVPDEARPVVCVQSGENIRAVGKWAGDVHPAFDAIYGFLRRLVEQAAAGSLPLRDAPSSDFPPPGFPDRHTIDALDILTPDQ